MGTIIEVDHAAQLITVAHSGSVTLDERLTAIQDVADLLRQCGGYGVLVDHTAALAIPTTLETHAIVSAKTPLAFLLRGGAAIVAPPGAKFGMARMEATLAENRGACIEVFTDAAQARSWLLAQRTAGV